MPNIATLHPAPTDARWRARQANLKVDVYLSMGKRDSARAVLAEASTAFPSNARLWARLDSLK